MDTSAVFCDQPAYSEQSGISLSTRVLLLS